jgi:hypothetical protein
MKRFDMGAVAATAICSLGAAGMFGLAAALPATWLQWEGAAARSQAALVAGAAASRAQSGLDTLFSTFDRATASLHADQLAGDTVPLTAKLLRIEPLVSPVSGLAVVNLGGMQIAASSVAIDPAIKPLWWTSAMPDLPKHGAGLLGCGGARPYVTGFALARRIADDAGNGAGAVAGLLAAPDLRKLVQPAGASVAFSLHDAAGCVLLHGNDPATAQSTGDQNSLLRLYRRLLPTGWGQPAETEATASVGNLTWSGVVSPQAALALRQSDIDAHAPVVERWAAGLAVLAVLLAAVPFLQAAGRRRGAVAQEVPFNEVEVNEVAVDDPASHEAAQQTAITPPARAPLTALVVGFTAAERQRVAARLEREGLEAETAEAGFLALDLAGRAAHLLGGLDLMVLDGANSNLPVHELLTQLKARNDLARLRIVLIANGCFAGAFGGPPQEAPALDELVTEVFSTARVAQSREPVLVAGE